MSKKGEEKRRTRVIRKRFKPLMRTLPLPLWGDNDNRVDLNH
ncbi:unnamed protein product, partial [Linum tenue]